MHTLLPLKYIGFLLLISTQALAVESARRVIETSEAVYLEANGSNQSHIVWVFPRTHIRVHRSAAAPEFIQVDLLLRDVQLPVNPGDIHPGWSEKRAFFSAVVAENECVLKQRPEMRFVQQFAFMKGQTINGAKRDALCTFTFTLNPDTPEILAQIEEDAKNGGLVQRDLKLNLLVQSSIEWRELHEGLVGRGVRAGSPLSPVLAAFEMGLLKVVEPIKGETLAKQEKFLKLAFEAVLEPANEPGKVGLKNTPSEGGYPLQERAVTVPL